MERRGPLLSLSLLNSFGGDIDELDVSEDLNAWVASGDPKVIADGLAPFVKPGATTGNGVVLFLASSFVADTIRLTQSQTLATKPIVEGFSGAIRILTGVDQATPITHEFLQSIESGFEDLWAETINALPSAEFVAVSDRVFKISDPLVILAWDAQQPPSVFGQQVVAVLDEKLAFYFGSYDTEAVGVVGERIGRLIVKEKPDLLGHVLVRQGDQWHRWLPPRSNALARARFVMMRRCALRGEYARQGRLLRKGREEYVATYMADTKDELTLLSVSPWLAGRAMLLPRAEMLVLGQSLLKQKKVSFDVFQKQLGHLLKQVEGLYPPRWLVDAFPTAEELAALPEMVHGGANSPLVEWWEEGVTGTSVELSPAYGVPTREQFAAEAQAVLAELGESQMEYSQEQFGVLLPADEKALPPGIPEGFGAMRVIGFQTPFERYRHSPAVERRLMLKNYFTDGLNELVVAPAARADVLPILRPQKELWQSGLQVKLQFPGKDVAASRAVSQSFVANRIRTSFVIDSSKAIRFVTDVELAVLALNEGSLFELAIANLEVRSTRPLLQVAAGVYVSPYEDDYDATRLLLPQLFTSLKLKGAPVAFVPNRSTLIVTGSEDVPGLIEAFARVRLAQKGDSRPVDAAPLRLAGDEWAVWLPPTSSAARPALEALVNEQLAGDHQSGGRLLKELWPNSVVAQIATRTRADKPWPEVSVLLPADPLAEVLLPMADLVLTADEFQLAWADFARVHAGRLRPVEGAEGRWWHLSGLQR